jgi:Plasmid pRiA4b ORF-3-like protein
MSNVVVVAEERYQLHVMLLDVGPAPWRRLLIRPDTTVDELHRLVQRCMGWDERAWHEFRIHGTLQFGRRSGYGGLDSGGTADTKLSHFRLIPGERFSYNYGNWCCQLRLEKIIVVARTRNWPVCTGGKWGAPPEASGGGFTYMNCRQRIRYPSETIDLLIDLIDDTVEQLGRFRERFENIAVWSRWMHFDRRRLNASFRSVSLAWDEERDDEISFAIGG